MDCESSVRDRASCVRNEPDASGDRNKARMIYMMTPAANMT